jgi:hypothetical protein
MKYVSTWYAGDAPVEHIKSKFRISKWLHNCDMKGCVINPGDRYLLITGKYSDEISSRKYCMNCVEHPDNQPVESA